MTEGLMGRLSQAAVQAPSPTMRHVHSSDRQGGTDLMGVQMRNSLIQDTSWVGGTMDDVTIENSRFLGSSLDLGISGSLHVADNKFELRNNPNVTKAAQFDCSAITASATRIVTFPDASGTMALHTASTTWTPTVSQSAAVTLTVQFARYQVLGKMAYVQARLTLTGGGTAGNQFIVNGIPAGIAPTRAGLHVPVGTFVYHDADTSYYQGAVIAIAANDLRFVTNNNGAAGVYFGNVPSMTLASGDELNFTAAWEIA